MKRCVEWGPKCGHICLHSTWGCSTLAAGSALVPQHKSSLKKGIKELSPWIFMDLHYIVMIDQWQLNSFSRPSSLPGSLRGWGWTFQPSNLLGSPSGQPASTLEVGFKNYLINRTEETLIILHTLEITRVLGVVSKELWVKIKCLNKSQYLGKIYIGRKSLNE